MKKLHASITPVALHSGLRRLSIVFIAYMRETFSLCAPLLKLLYSHTIFN